MDLPSLAEEEVRLNPDVIVATPIDSAVAVRKVTSTIPIVSGALADAVHLGLIASEARPGGNVTGIEPPALYCAWRSASKCPRRWSRAPTR